MRHWRVLCCRQHDQKASSSLAARYVARHEKRLMVDICDGDISSWHGVTSGNVSANKLARLGAAHRINGCMASARCGREAKYSTNERALPMRRSTSRPASCGTSRGWRHRRQGARATTRLLATRVTTFCGDGVAHRHLRALQRCAAVDDGGGER